ncbi:MAG: serine/threonine protein kinase [Plesiomonas sp.]|uniref:serine/threonine protein kinase n=1 Tax=Plesiomonas sp. TaxID=2486279 RepID=UPI003F3CDA80
MTSHSGSAFAFQTLSPDLIMDALEAVGLRVDSGLLALNSYENRVYQFLDEDRRRYVVKFYRPGRWSEGQILEEHQFAQELADAEIPVVAALVLNGQTLHRYQDFLFAVFPSVGGRQYEVDNLEQLEWVGRFMGRLHQQGRKQRFAERPTMGLDEYLYQPRDFLQQSGFIPDGLRNVFFSDLNLLISEIEQRWYADWQPLRLHGDCHPGNILWRDGPLFVDLDDARNGPAMQDLWMLLNGDRNERLMQLDLLIESYSEFSDFTAREVQLIEPLRGLRMVHYMAWLARRWEDPAFPRSFPWFAEPRYWEQQILACKEQIAALREPPLQLMPMY